MTDKITLQAFADQCVIPEFQQPLKTADEVVTLQGWGDVNGPRCCGSNVKILTCIGQPYYAECETCKKFAARVDGPSFDKSSVQFLSDEKVDLDTDCNWIIGVQP